MNNVFRTCLVALVGFLATVALAPAAQAYPDFRMDPVVSPTVVVEGHTFDASVSANADCDWAITFEGDVRTGHTAAFTKFSTQYVAPDVDERTTYPVRFVCNYDDSTIVDSDARADRAAQGIRTLQVTVIPLGEGAGSPTENPGSGSLPGTGGPSMLFLIGGLVLLLVGAGAVKYARSREEDAADGDLSQA